MKHKIKVSCEIIKQPYKLSVEIDGKKLPAIEKIKGLQYVDLNEAMELKANYFILCDAYGVGTLVLKDIEY